MRAMDPYVVAGDEDCNYRRNADRDEFEYRRPHQADQRKKRYDNGRGRRGIPQRFRQKFDGRSLSTFHCGSACAVCGREGT